MRVKRKVGVNVRAAYLFEPHPCVVEIRIGPE
jgi:hypothetical protein